jgi:hypothetical protein
MGKTDKTVSSKRRVWRQCHARPSARSGPGSGAAARRKGPIRVGSRRGSSGLLGPGTLASPHRCDRPGSGAPSDHRPAPIRPDHVARSRRGLRDAYELTEVVHHRGTETTRADRSRPESAAASPPGGNRKESDRSLSPERIEIPSVRLTSRILDGVQESPTTRGAKGGISESDRKICFSVLSVPLW